MEYDKYIGKPMPYNVKTWFGRLAFRRVKKIALKLHLFYNKQFWIMPDSDNDCVIVDNNFIKYYNKNVKKSNRIDFRKLEAIAYYKTPSHSLIKPKNNMDTVINNSNKQL